MLVLLFTSSGMAYLLGDLYGFKRGIEKAKEIYTR
jgi:hypothetical protein